MGFNSGFKGLRQGTEPRCSTGVTRIVPRKKRKISVLTRDRGDQLYVSFLFYLATKVQSTSET